MSVWNSGRIMFHSHYQFSIANLVFLISYSTWEFSLVIARAFGSATNSQSHSIEIGNFEIKREREREKGRKWEKQRPERQFRGKLYLIEWMSCLFMRSVKWDEKEEKKKCITSNTNHNRRRNRKKDDKKKNLSQNGKLFYFIDLVARVLTLEAFIIMILQQLATVLFANIM